MIHYLSGDATAPVGDGQKIIAHVCNDAGGWGRGFVLALSKRWPEPEQAYREWARTFGYSLPLGAVQLVLVDDGLMVANMVAQHHWTFDTEGNPPIRYDALAHALGAVAQEAQVTDASVHMPRIGCGLAGGKWEIIEPLIEEKMSALDVYVYTL